MAILVINRTFPYAPLNIIFHMFSAFLRKHSHVNWALTDQAMVSGVNFLTGVLFARYLGLEEYGRFTLAWMAVLFCNSFQHAGIIAPMMSIGPKQKQGNEAAYYGAVFIQQIFCSVVCFFLLWGSIWLSNFFKPELHIQHLALPLATTLLAWQLQDFLRRYFFVRGHGGLAFLNDAISYLGQLILLIMLFRLIPLNTTLVLWLIAGTSTLAVIVGICRLGNLSWSQNIFAEVIQKHWRFSKWMLASSIVQWINGNIFNIVAGAVLGAAAVGALKASQNIIAVTHVLFQGLENIVPIKASHHYYKRGILGLKNYLGIILKIGIPLTALLTAIVGVFPKFWLTFIYGQEYQEHGIVLSFFSFTYFLMFIGLILRIALRTLEHTKPIFVSYFFATIISLFFSYPLINNYNVAGAAFGHILIQLTVLAILFSSLSKTVSSNTERKRT